MQSREQDARSDSAETDGACFFVSGSTASKASEEKGSAFLRDLIPASWAEALKDECDEPYFKALSSFLEQEYAGTTIYPPRAQIFRALELCAPESVRVVIIGQDPYHGPGQANGLAFSVAAGVAMPPSLANIFKEVATDTGAPISRNGELERWASQGVLLLNTALTVRARQPNSHASSGWTEFTSAILRFLNDRSEQSLVFLLWGKHAKTCGKDLDRRSHRVLEAAHPSPYSAASGFFGCKHFSRTNEHLKSIGRPLIDWR